MRDNQIKQLTAGNGWSLRARFRFRQGRNGSVLVFVLWLLVVLSAVALTRSFAAHLRSQATATLGRQTQELFLARAGIETAIRDLQDKRDEMLTPVEEDPEQYVDVPFGGGKWTLLAGYDEEGEPLYGLADEAAKLNISTAEASVLANLPGMDAELAADMVAARQSKAFHNLSDLLLLEKMTPELLYGEDVNGNLLLDSNENDGVESWPPDDGDGRLQCGLAGWMTVWSATRNVDANNKKRINVNSAGADEMTKGVQGLTSDEAESIVQARGKNQFKSIADLLDVELVTKSSTSATTTTTTLQRDRTRDPGQDAQFSQPRGENRAATSSSTTTTTSTGQKAFSASRLEQIADYVTTSGDDVAKGLINVNRASKEVLMCLPDVTDSIAREIVRAREEKTDGFASVAELLKVQSITQEMFKKLCPLITTRGDVYSTCAYGVLDNGDTRRGVRTVIDYSGDKARIAYWLEVE